MSALTHSLPNMTDMATLLKRLDTVDALPEAARLRDRGYDLLRLQLGGAVLDAGCGSGRAVYELSQRGMRGSGIDPSEQMIDAARERWPGMDFRRASAERLPFGDGELDGYRADKVLHVLPDPAEAIGEARRVLRPGGRILLVGPDWDLMAIDADDHDLTRRIVRARAAAMPSPNIARGYANLLRDSGFTDVAVEVHTTFPPPEVVLAGLSQTAAEIPGSQDWFTDQHTRTTTNRSIIAIPIFLATATR